MYYLFTRLNTFDIKLHMYAECEIQSRFSFPLHQQFTPFLVCCWWPGKRGSMSKLFFACFSCHTVGVPTQVMSIYALCTPR